MSAAGDSQSDCFRSVAKSGLLASRAGRMQASVDERSRRQTTVPTTTPSNGGASNRSDWRKRVFSGPFPQVRGGQYPWQCFLPCGLGYLYGNGGPMQTVGYMDGFLKVVA